MGYGGAGLCYTLSMIRLSPLWKRIVVSFTISLTATLLLFLLINLMFVDREKLQPPAPDALYRQSSVPVEARITDLISYMTLEEKIGQMALVEKNSIIEREDISTYGLGALLSGFGAKPEVNTPTGWKTMVEGFIAESKNSRLGIPILYGVDAIHGHTNVPGATVFPHMIGLGAAGDEALVSAVAQAVGRWSVVGDCRPHRSSVYVWRQG